MRPLALRPLALRSFQNQDVADVFDAYPKELKPRLLRLRELIFEVAQKTAGVGPLEETLKWGQPSYETKQTKSGSPLRIDQIKSRKGAYGIYVHCQTTLIGSFRERHGDTLRLEGNRAIVFEAGDRLPVKALGDCIALALTYHRDKKQRP